MYFQDGKDEEVKISKLAGDKIKTDENVTAAKNLAHHMVTFSKLSDGTYDVKVVDGNNKVGMDWVGTPAVTNVPAQQPTYTSTYYKQKIGGYTIADDAVVFVQTADSTKALTGKQVKNWSDNPTTQFTAENTDILTKDTNGVAYVKFAVLFTSATGSKVPGASNDKLYAYLTADPYQADVDGEKKAAYDVWNGSKNVTLYVDASNDSTSAKAGNVIEYSEDGKYIDDVSVVGKIDTNTAGSTGMVFITGINNDVITYRDNTGHTQTMDLDKDCQYIAVNDDKTEGMEGSKDTVTKANEVVISGTTYLVPNAYIKLNTDGDKVVAIVFDADDSQLNVATNANTFLLAK